MLTADQIAHVQATIREHATKQVVEETPDGFRIVDPIDPQIATALAMLREHQARQEARARARGELCRLFGFSSVQLDCVALAVNVARALSQVPV